MTIPFPHIRPLGIGAAIGLTLVTLFLWGADAPDPAWSALWWVRPLIIVPLAGAAGGYAHQVLAHWQRQGRWLRGLMLTASAVLFLIGLWLGFVLGFDGTYWN